MNAEIIYTGDLTQVNRLHLNGLILKSVISGGSVIILKMGNVNLHKDIQKEVCIPAILALTIFYLKMSYGKVKIKV